MAYIRLIDVAEAEGELRMIYEAMKDRPMPAVYRAPHGGAAGIVRAHSLDPALMFFTFSTSATMQGDPLSWPERELIATSASRTNQCVY
jgi:hypothetical protein